MTFLLKYFLYLSSLPNIVYHVSMSYRTCRRCSVTRVNTLCELYEHGFRNGDHQARKNLAKLTQMAMARGYSQGSGVLLPGLSESSVRSLCWNISSLLTDEDMSFVGLNGGKK